MPENLTVLIYKDSQWVELRNRDANPNYNSGADVSATNKPYAYVGGSPVLAVDIEDLAGAPLEATILLNNRHVRPQGDFVEPTSGQTFVEDPLVNPQIPQFFDYIPDNARIIIHDSTTYMTLFVGRVFISDEAFSIDRGSTLELICRDALEEIHRNTEILKNLDYQQDILNKSWHGDHRSSTYRWNPYDSYYKLIKDIGLKTIDNGGADSTQEILFEDEKNTSLRTGKLDRNPTGGVFNGHAFTQAEVLQDANNKTDVAIEYSHKRDTPGSALKRIQDIAATDYYFGSGGEKHFGFSFHLDATRVSPLLQNTANPGDETPQQDFVYYRRGANHALIGEGSDLDTYGLKVKYGVRSVEDSGRTRNLFHDGAEFTSLPARLVTHVSLTYNSKEDNNFAKADVIPGYAPRLYLNGRAWDHSDTSLGHAKRKDLDPRVKTDAQNAKYEDAGVTSPQQMGGTHDLKEALGVNLKSATIEKQKMLFTIIYVDHADTSGNTIPNFSVNLDDNLNRSFFQVSSLHTVPKVDSNSRQMQSFFAEDAADNQSGVTAYPKTYLGNVQAQGKDIHGRQYLILSNPQEDMLATLTAEQELFERSHYLDKVTGAADQAPNYPLLGGSSDQAAKVKFVSYPPKTYGTRRTAHVDGTDTISFLHEELRNIVANTFAKSNNNAANRYKKGQFAIKDWPHIEWSGEAGLGSTGSTLKTGSIQPSIKSITSITAASPTVITTSSAHGIANNTSVTITDSNSTPTINGTHTVTVLSSTTFSIPVKVSAAGTLGEVEYKIANTSPLQWKFGIRKGASVRHIADNGDNYVGYVGGNGAGGLANDTLTGVTLYKASELNQASPDQHSWSFEDNYKIYVPYRVGMSMRVEHPLMGVAADSIIESINYHWANGRVRCEIKTIGKDDAVKFNTRENLKDEDPLKDHPDLNSQSFFEDYMLAAGAYTARGVMWWHDHELGETPSLAPAAKRDYNTFSWSGGYLLVNGPNGARYEFLAGDTDQALTDAGGASAGYTSPMQPNTQYILYLNRNDITYGGGKYKLRIDINNHDADYGYIRQNDFIEIAYMTIGKQQKAGEKTIGLPGENYYSVTIPFDDGIVDLEFLYAFDNIDGLAHMLQDASRIVTPNSMTSALLKRSARPWTSNLTISAYGNNYNQIVWNNGTANSNATLTWASTTNSVADTEIIAHGSRQSGSGDGAFANNTTNYMYLDLAHAAPTVPKFTTTYSTAVGDEKVLLALIVVGDDSDQKAPTILPFNSKVPTLNAVAIAADAITADHVQAGTLGVDKLTSAAQGDISEKTKTHVGGSAPSWTPRTNDIWFDTDPQPTVIKVYDGSNWEVRNSNAPEGGGIQTFSSLLTNVPSTTGQKDLWLTSDTHQLFVAMHGPGGTSNQITSGEWTLKDDAEAINSGTTTIEGGLIRTNRIKLLSGKLLAEGSTANYQNAFDSTVIAGGNTNRQTNGAINNTVGTITIDGYQSGQDPAHERIYAGDVILILNANSSTYEKMYVTGGSDTSLNVIRGWSGTTVDAHNDNVDIWRFAYSQGGYTNPHIIMDNYGITGYSNEFTPEFSLSAETGKGTFGGGNIEVGDGGIAFGEGAHSGERSIKWTHNPSSGDGTSFLYREPLSGSSGGRKLVFSMVGSGATAENSAVKFLTDIEMFAAKINISALGSITDGTTNITSFSTAIPSSSPSGNKLVTEAAIKTYVDANGGTTYSAGNGITISGTTISLDTSYAATWSATQYYNGANHYINNSLTVNGTTNLNGGMNFGNSSADTITFYGKVAAGTFGSPAIQFTSSGDNGLFSETDGSYQRIKWKGSGGTSNFPGFSHDGTYGYCFANAGSFGTCYVTGDVIANVGSASGPTYTFTGNTTSGMYYSSAGVEISRSSSRIATFGSAGVSFYGGNVYIDDLPSTSSATNLRKGTDDFLYVVTSTLKSKMNVRDLEIDSSNVYTLEPKTFDMRNQYRDANDRWAYGDTPTNTDFGMIAEEVYNILPELVNLDKEGEPQSINYDMLSVLLLAEIKKLNARIDVLEGN